MKLINRKSKYLPFRQINPAIKFLIISDVFVVGASGMFAPLFALFVENFIVDGSAMVVSIAMGIYLVSRSLLQIPIATTIDRIKGERDDFLLMVIFSLFSSFSLFLYLFIDQAWQLFLVQLLLGVSTAITYPSYMALFTRHIDRHREGTEWGIYYTLTDMGSAVLAVLGGYLATQYSFDALIITTALISIAGSLLLLPVRPSLKM